MKYLMRDPEFLYHSWWERFLHQFILQERFAIYPLDIRDKRKARKVNRNV